MATPCWRVEVDCSYGQHCAWGVWVGNTNTCNLYSEGNNFVACKKGANWISDGPGPAWFVRTNWVSNTDDIYYAKSQVSPCTPMFVEFGSYCEGNSIDHIGGDNGVERNFIWDDYRR
jgi:hypothetical protein